MTALTAHATTVDSTSSYNKYTLITLRGSASDNIKPSFPISPTKTYLGLYPFTLSTFSSIYSN
jgi:hypothetical protein